MCLPKRGLVVVCLFLALLLAAPAAAQRELAGAAETKLALERLQELGSVLMIAAHPDDENTAVLAYFARGRHMRTAYLALTRGEGGQNLIGSEQGDLMGVIRTQELLAARRIDGAEQFFTRAIDFGFSKTADESLAKWGREEVLSDVVWVIRKMQPDVIIERFSGTPRDGHGHHQAAGILGREAYQAAADPNRFPEQLQYVSPWQAKRLVYNVFGRGEPPPGGTISIDAGEYDPLLGYSYAEIAGMSRSKHRSQGFGSAERKGPAVNSFDVEQGLPASSDLFDGIGTSWNSVPGGAVVARILDRAVAGFDPEHPDDTIPALLEAREQMEGLNHPLVPRKLKELDEAVALCAGLWLDATVDRDPVIPGETVNIETTSINRSRYPIELVSVDVEGAGSAEPGETLLYNQPLEIPIEWSVPKDQPLSDPYWLREPKQGELYTVPQQLRGQPDTDAVLTARFHLRAADRDLEIERPVIYRWVDNVRGELERPLSVEPPVSLVFLQDVALFPRNEPRDLAVSATALRDNTSGQLHLDLPTGWTAEPASRDFSIASAGEQVTVTFTVTPPEAPSTTEVTAVAQVGDAEIRSGVRVIDYEHIPEQTLTQSASADLLRVNAQVLARRVGYVMGVGDYEPQALRELGCEVVLLDADDLARGDLDSFDAIVTGVRAYNVRDDLVANQRRLLDYVERGGTLIVQYNTARGGFGPGGRGPDPLSAIGPYPLSFNSGRVTVEEAPMTVLAPDSPVLHSPNEITEADYEGWVQERGLYFASEWDDRYTPIWSAHDPDEEPLEGSTLVTKYGDGVFVFTALSWFRQLPAGVPGAYRIFANLLSAGETIP